MNVSYRFVLNRTATILSVAILTLVLVGSLTGILLSFYYEPTAGGAFDSLETITTAVQSGWLIRGLHKAAGNWTIILGLFQIVVMFLGRQFKPTWLRSWLSGILMVLAAMGLSWTAILLDWTQTGYWRFKVEMGIIETIPLVGPQIREILSGGAVGSVSVQHMYTLHSYVLAVGAVVLAVLHLLSLLQQERTMIAEFYSALPEENRASGAAEQVDPSSASNSLDRSGQYSA